MGAFHKAVMRFRAPEILCDFFDGEAVARRQPRHRLDFHAQHEQMFVQGAVMPDMPDHHRRRIAHGPGQERGGAADPRHLPCGDSGHEFRDRDQG